MMTVKRALHMAEHGLMQTVRTLTNEQLSEIAQLAIRIHYDASDVVRHRIANPNRSGAV